MSDGVFVERFTYGVHAFSMSDGVFVERFTYGVHAFSMSDGVFVERFTRVATASNVVLSRKVDCLKEYLPIQI